MEKFNELMESAEKKLNFADYILSMTYPLVKDPKLLLSVAENMFLAFNYSLTSLLYYERHFKRIPPFQDNFSLKLQLFKDECAERYGIGNEQLKAMQELKEILIAHKKSPIEFPRKESFMIFNESYEAKTLTQDLLKDYIKKAKLFIKKLSTIIRKEN
ncbi:MAG: hypothetical protein AABX34_01280 [Nanoarchaeota archaeon]